jgi:branched-chain amino acid transport system substrate-binding protein
MIPMARFGAVLLLLGGLVAGPIALSGCGSTGGGGASSGGLSDSETKEARTLFQRVSNEHSLQKDAQAVATAEVLLSLYPAYERNDEALVLAIDSADRLGQPAQALSFTDQLLEGHPASNRVNPALGRASEIAAAAGDSLRGADYLATLYERDPAGQTGPGGQPVAERYFEGLAEEDLGRLSSAHHGEQLFPYLEMLRVRHLMAAGQVVEAESMVLELENLAPGSPWTLAARDILLGGPGLALSGEPVEVNPMQVGVICPLTGRYAVLGNAFYDAALLALDATNLELGTSFELKVEDSEGDPVAGALAARRLCQEEGSVALLGAMMSDPTAAVALVADQWQVPLVSPTATNERIWELGDEIFQTNLTGIYETRLLASLASTVMLKQRFAILYPDDPEGRGYADVFRTEVEGLGGKIVAAVPFPARGTDYKDPILAVRKARPEVIFVPASVDQMVLIGPQLDFYKAGSLVLGLSNWNSEKLLEKSGTVLERAVFPNDLALFPSRWTAEFRDTWNGENYPREASTLALKTYQATRMLLDTMGSGEVTSRLQLAHALKNRMASRDFHSEGPESLARTVRMIRDLQIVPFPGARFAEAWQLTEGAVADSLGMEPVPGSEDTEGF